MEAGSVIGGRFDRGGMGDVWRARERLSGQEVAVKLLIVDSVSRIARAVREARALATIRHPAVVRYVAHEIRAYLENLGARGKAR